MVLCQIQEKAPGIMQKQWRDRIGAAGFSTMDKTDKSGEEAVLHTDSGADMRYPLKNSDRGWHLGEGC